jgi:hypothetical protein
LVSFTATKKIMAKIPTFVLMKDFKCYDCGHIFKAKGQKKEYRDPIYGPCSKWVAPCPECQQEAGEFAVKAGKGKKNSGGAPCGNYDSCSCCGG